MPQAAEMVEAAVAARVLYLGDHDPSGYHIPELRLTPCGN
jgi:hypothetical protein